MKRCHLISALVIGALCYLPFSFAKPYIPDRNPSPGGWPMFGGTPSRNMVNPHVKKLPSTWSIEPGQFKNIKWVAELGDRTFGSPVVADGKVYIGSNGNRPKEKSGKSILYAFREADGNLLWSISHDDPPQGHTLHQQIRGLFSTPTIEANRVYYVTPLSEVICADSADGKILWRYDMVREPECSQDYIFVCPAFQFNGNLCAPLVVGDFVYVVTCNGADDDGKVSAPNAPSFLALHKKTGAYAWSSSLPGDKIILGNWSNPAFAYANRQPQVIFAGGDGVVYSFEPNNGNLIWKCDCLPFRRERKDRLKDNYFVGTPVVVEDRLYIGLGSYPESPDMRENSYFLCLDITKRGDVSLKSYDKDAKENKDSALVWAFGGPNASKLKGDPSSLFHRTASTAAVQDGLVYIPDFNGYLHCLDAKTGGLVWRHDLQANVWASPLWADGRVFICDTDGMMHILAHGRTKKLLATIDMDEQIETTPTAANGVLYVTTKSKLYAIAR